MLMNDWGLGTHRPASGWGSGCRKDHGVIRKWELSAPLTSGDWEELEMELLS